MEIKGKVKAVLPLKSGTSAKGEWKRQVVIVEYQDGQYTSTVALENAKKADEFGKLNVGDEVTFKCNTPTSREYNGNWYTSVNCWGWDVEGKSETIAEPQPTTTTTTTEDAPF